MKNKTDRNSIKWIQTRAFYGVLASLVLLIVGVTTAIYNVSKIRNAVPYTGNDTTYYSAESTTDNFRANVTATGIADERKETTTSQTTSVHDDNNAPYIGYFLLPIDSKICKDYSEGDMVYSETMKDWRTHDGIDVQGKKGNKVIAINDGTVSEVYHDDLWGGTVVIEHGNGLCAKYCGVAATVKKGDKIAQGKTIGTLELIPIESSDGYHIHLETVVEKKTVNPVKALNLMSVDANATE